jgi:uncharacterized protein
MEPELAPLDNGSESEPAAGKNPPPDYDTTHEERLWGMLAYFLTFFTWIFGPVVLYAVKREQSRYIAFHALQAILLDLTLVALWPVLQIMPKLGMFLAPILYAAKMVYGVLAAIKAYDGEWYEVPLIGRWARKQARVDG